MKRVLISAVEASGDLLGAELVVAMAARARFLATGLGGPRMEAAGLVRLAGTVFDPVMGGWEVVRHLATISRNTAALTAAIAERPDVLVTIDAPDFHLPLAREAKRKGVKVVQYVSPQLWAWRRTRAEGIARSLDRLLCLFPFEPAIYAPYGLDARWVGHPVVDRVSPSAREPGVVAIFPGSRRAEVARHLAPFLAAVEGMGEVLVAEGAPLPPLPSWARAVPSAEALARADRALTKSGTVTLELALAGIPTVVAHRVAWLTYFLGRALVRGVRHLALPNILLEREAIREYVQRFTPDQLRRSLKSAEPPPTQELRALLGPRGASTRAAEAVLDFLA
ncbi:MAG: lipid-A-disaccharide synthase [Myxococcota bacterium]